jgi:hypothetical protein
MSNPVSHVLPGATTLHGEDRTTSSDELAVDHLELLAEGGESYTYLWQGAETNKY